MVILGRSPILTPGLRFLPLFLDWPFSSHSPFYQKNLLYPHLKNPSTLYWFFLPDSKFSPLLKGFLPIVHFSREISPSINKISVNLCVIFPNICHFHLSCQVLSVFANSPFVAQKFDRFPTFSQQLPTTRNRHAATCNRVCKQTLPVTSKNVGSCWPTILRPFARGLTRVSSLLLFQVLGCHIVWAHGRTVSFSMFWRTRDEGYVYSDHYKTGAVQSTF